MLTGSLLLLAIFLFPIWKIILVAPQYPSGVTMLIYLNKIGGTEPGTLQNINILNHYVGMKSIEPDSIPELTYFPFIIHGLCLIGIVISFLNKKYLYLGFAALLVLLASLGVYDFYLWEYEYGHSLSPDAPIKVPGASFQPPLIGKKDIINFTAYSLPETGVYLYGATIFAALSSWWLTRKK